MPCKKKEIKDIVYEYVYFTEVEEVVIEEPLFQRLRFVFQNSCAYLTYPSNQLTRFSHSLGVMHLGGSLFRNGILNASDEDYVLFLNSTHALLKSFFESENHQFENFIEQWNIDIGNVGEFPVRNISSAQQFSDQVYLFILNYVWQSIRLACLIHDIGHFPFSHIFEMGIESFERRNDSIAESPITVFKQVLANELNISIEKIEDSEPTKLHEFFGAYILKQFSKKFENETSGNKFYFSKALDFAEKIFLVDRDSHIDLFQNLDPLKIILCLHKIVSSDIDADRLDYVLRDSISSGINFGNFDFNRIILNSKVFGYLEKEGQQKVFDFFVTDKALSSIEQFFNHRYLLYQHLYFHHNVSKYDGILIEALAILLELAIVKKNKKVIEILNEYRFIDSQHGFLPLDHIENYDDSWLRTLFQDVYRNSDEINDNILHFLLETFLFRKKQNTYSFVKKSSEIDDFLRGIKADENRNFQIESKFKELRTGYKACGLSDRTEWVWVDYVKFLFSEYFKANIKKEFLSNVKTKFSEIDLVFIHKDTPPKIADKKSTVLRGNSQMTITSLSKYLNSFTTIGTFSFKHYFGVVGHDIKSNSELIKTAEALIHECLFEALLKCIDLEIEAIRRRNYKEEIKDN